MREIGENSQAEEKRFDKDEKRGRQGEVQIRCRYGRGEKGGRAGQVGSLCKVCDSISAPFTQQSVYL